MSDPAAMEGSALEARPLYVQVKDHMVHRLISGVWRPGMVLPSEGQLAVEFGVSQGTVRKALDLLAAENLVVRQQGRGTFIAEHDEHRALFHFFHLVGEDGSRKLPGGTVLRCRQARANRSEAARLALARGAPVTRVYRIRDLDGVPAIVEAITVPLDVFPGFGSDGALPNTLYELYESRWGVTITRAEEHLRAVASEPAEAALLGLEPGAPLLEIDRIAFALDGRPVEWRVSRCDTRRHYYLAELI